MIDKGKVDVSDTLDWTKPLNFQDSYEKISPSKQTAEATYLAGGTVLEFNVVVPTEQYIRPTDWELVLSVRSETGTEIKFIWEGGYPTISFFGHYLETITILGKDDLKAISHPRPPGSIAVYLSSVAEGMGADQLAMVERDALFDKAAVAGLGVRHRLGAGGPFTPCRRLVDEAGGGGGGRFSRDVGGGGGMFTRVLDGEGDYALDSVIQRSDFNLFFSINSEIYAYVWFPSCFGAALSLAGGWGAPWVVGGSDCLLAQSPCFPAGTVRRLRFADCGRGNLP